MVFISMLRGSRGSSRSTTQRRRGSAKKNKESQSHGHSFDGGKEANEQSKLLRYLGGSYLGKHTLSVHLQNQFLMMLQ